MYSIKFMLFVATIHLVENKKLPFSPEPDGQCLDKATYFHKTKKLCCSLCQPGFRQKTECTASSDTVCEVCTEGFYSDTLTHHGNCFRCSYCDEDVSLVYAQRCRSWSDARCACKEGTYCSFKENGKCSECTDITSCPQGEGVSKHATADSDAECSPCPEGTFSDKDSYTETCQKHTDCAAQGRNTIRPGNTTSDAVCGGSSIAASVTTATTTTVPPKASTQAVLSIFTTTTSLRPVVKPQDGSAIIVTVIGASTATILMLIIVITAVVLNRKRRGDTNNNINMDANKALHAVSVLGQHGCSTTHATEQQLLLGEKDSSNPSLSSSSSSSSSSCCSSSSSPKRRGPAAPDCSHSGAVHSSSPEGNTHPDSPQSSSPTVTVNINTTISCHVSPTGTYVCSVPTSPATASTPSSANRDQDHDRNLPLSTEEERLYPSPAQPSEDKEAHTAVQESGKVVC
ncbi:hypothetical protein AGOR_G00134500 [Albula goreensis]|uniref:TNFR-Cys domain-containing protein n=1 Tax=Albula goreensis TaxID=1534307 RepID=A0A8T3D8B4_9TELE|nr:hypothetical protein AGOR_G00134500 [Albula goreensis]